MNNITLLEHTQQLLADPLLNGESVDEKIRYLLKEEYLRRLAQYRRAIFLLEQKYGLSFDEFVSRRIVQQENFSWQAEKDAMAKLALIFAAKRRTRCKPAVSLDSQIE